MFLNRMIIENKPLIDATRKLHEEGLIMPDTYVIDIDTLLKNAQNILKLAKQNNIELFFMLKQIGRNPYIAQKLIDLGYSGAVAVDYKEALTMIDHNIKLGNVGHIVQIPKNLLTKIIEANPQFITIYTIESLVQINDICQKKQKVQKILLKVIDVENDLIYNGQHGGFLLEQLTNFKTQIQKLHNIEIVGLTAFPCLTINENEQINITNNVKTVLKAKKILEKQGFIIKELNLPSATGVNTIHTLKDIGATQAEPGHALTGTSPFMQTKNNSEKIAIVYLSEISHTLKNHSYCYGGGHYRRSNVQSALIDDQIVKITPVKDQSIDYYFQVNGIFEYGKAVLMCFRTQIFVTRSNVVLVKNLKTTNPQIIGEYDPYGKKIK